MGDAPEEHLVSSTELRRRFNDGNHWQRAEAGEFRQVIVRIGHPSSERSGEPFCTRSQSIDYWHANGESVAKVHRYLRPDGTGGGPGLPDPKVLVENGIRCRVLDPDQGLRR